MTKLDPLPTEERCDKAPPGWRCHREAGHDGPCAATSTSVRYPEDDAPITARDIEAMESVIDELWKKKLQTPQSEGPLVGTTRELPPKAERRISESSAPSSPDPYAVTIEIKQ